MRFWGFSLWRYHTMLPQQSLIVLVNDSAVSHNYVWHPFWDEHLNLARLTPCRQHAPMFPRLAPRFDAAAAGRLCFIHSFVWPQSDVAAAASGADATSASAANARDGWQLLLLVFLLLLTFLQSVTPHPIIPTPSTSKRGKKVFRSQNNQPSILWLVAIELNTQLIYCKLAFIFIQQYNSVSRLQNSMWT